MAHVQFGFLFRKDSEFSLWAHRSSPDPAGPGEPPARSAAPAAAQGWKTSLD